MELKKYWAKQKPFQSIYTHSIVTGTIEKLLFESYISTKEKRHIAELLGLTVKESAKLLGYLASLHDIGKFHISFQCSDKEAAKQFNIDSQQEKIIRSLNYRHELSGKIMLRRLWEEQGQSEDAADIFSEIIGSHHPKETGQGSHTKDLNYHNACEAFERDMRVLFLGIDVRKHNLPGIVFEYEKELKTKLINLLIFANDIASTKDFADAEDWITDRDSTDKIAEKLEAWLHPRVAKKFELAAV